MLSSCLIRIGKRISLLMLLVMGCCCCFKPSRSICTKYRARDKLCICDERQYTLLPFSMSAAKFFAVALSMEDVAFVARVSLNCSMKPSMCCCSVVLLLLNLPDSLNIRRFEILDCIVCCGNDDGVDDSIVIVANCDVRLCPNSMMTIVCIRSRIQNVVKVRAPLRGDDDDDKDIPIPIVH